MQFTDEQKLLIDDESTNKQVIISFPNTEIENITNSKIYAEEMSLEGSLVDQDNFAIGKCNSDLFKIKVADFNEDIMNQEMVVTVKFANESMETELEVPFGRFIVNTIPERTSDRRYLIISAQDFMIKFDVDIAEWYNTVLFTEEVTERTVSEILSMLCEYIGVDYDNTFELLHGDLVVKKNIQPTQLSGRDFLQQICELNACFGHFNELGVLSLYNLKNSFNSVAEGKNLTLKNTVYNKLIPNFYGYTKQDGTPTPDTLIHVDGLGDKGYFDGDLLQGFYSISDGVFTSNTAMVCSANMISCKPGDIVTLKYEENVYGLALTYYDSEKNFISAKAINNTDELTGTIPNNVNYFHIYVAVEDGNTITPSTAKHISVTVNGMYAIRVKTTNEYETEETEALIPISSPLYDGDYIEVYADGTGQIVRNNIVFENPTFTNSSGLWYWFGGGNVLKPYTDSYCNKLNKADNRVGADQYGNVVFKLLDGQSIDDLSDSIFVCKLSTPTIKSLTVEQVDEIKKLYTFDGTTNVLFDGNIKVVYQTLNHISPYKNVDYEDYNTEKINSVQIRLEEDDIGATYTEDGVTNVNQLTITGNSLLFHLSSEELTSVAQAIYNQIKDISFTPNETLVKGGSYFNYGDKYLVNAKIPMENEVVVNTFESYVLTKSINGIQGMSTLIGAKGSQYQPQIANDIITQMKIINGRSAKVKADMESLKVEYKDFEKNVSSTLEQQAESVAIKIDKDGNVVSNLNVDENGMGFVGNKFVVKADNFSIDEEGIARAKALHLLDQLYIYYYMKSDPNHEHPQISPFLGVGPFSETPLDYFTIKESETGEINVSESTEIGRTGVTATPTFTSSYNTFDGSVNVKGQLRVKEIAQFLANVLFSDSVKINNYLICDKIITSDGASNYITDNDLPDFINQLLGDYVTDGELSDVLANYITSSALTTKLSSYVTNSALTTKLASYPTNSDVQDYVVGKFEDYVLDGTDSKSATNSGLTVKVRKYGKIANVTISGTTSAVLNTSGAYVTLATVSNYGLRAVTKRIVCGSNYKGVLSITSAGAIRLGQTTTITTNGATTLPSGIAINVDETFILD